MRNPKRLSNYRYLFAEMVHQAIELGLTRKSLLECADWGVDGINQHSSSEEDNAMATAFESILEDYKRTYTDD